jgi:hypothetical protein
LVDVGGGVGNALKQIISEYPSIKGINFDLPQVIQDAQPHPGKIYIYILPFYRYYTLIYNELNKL